MYLCFVLGDFQVGILKTQVAYLDEKTGLKDVPFGFMNIKKLNFSGL